VDEKKGEENNLGNIPNLKFKRHIQRESYKALVRQDG